MISDDQIPQEAADALFAVLVTRGSPKRAIAAAIEAWPQRQKVHNREGGSLTVWTRDFIILPLEQPK
jgi:hypothetical protein